MAYTKSGHRVCDYVQFGKGICQKPAPHDFASKTGLCLHYCTKHQKQSLKAFIKPAKR